MPSKCCCSNACSSYFNRAAKDMFALELQRASRNEAVISSTTQASESTYEASFHSSSEGDGIPIPLIYTYTNIWLT